jgi:hypothetical protein
MRLANDLAQLSKRHSSCEFGKSPDWTTGHRIGPILPCLSRKIRKSAHDVESFANTFEEWRICELFHLLLAALHSLR